jgi:hypothetical protein
VIKHPLYETSLKDSLTMAPKDTPVDELSTSNRKAIFAMLLGSVENGKLKHGIKKGRHFFHCRAIHGWKSVRYSDGEN